jgi:3-oxoacyl-[acyl-carrier-protein] synthase III
LDVTNVYLSAAASAFGSRIIPSEEVDQAYGMPEGKLRTRAGILSVAYAAENETEESLAEDACRKVFEQCSEDAQSLEGVIAASETHHAYPSLAANLHTRLKLRERCMALPGIAASAVCSAGATGGGTRGKDPDCDFGRP